MDDSSAKTAPAWGELPLRTPMTATGSPALGGFFPTLRSPVVAGIDEAGRGCLAGPVVAAAVILPENYTLPGLADSKALAPSRRDGLAAAIGQCAIAWGLGVIWPQVIDETDILQATLVAMSRAAATLKVRPEALLIDGNQRVSDILLRRAGFTVIPTQQTVIDGDARVPVISAASILAKCFRDRLMEKLDARYPGYGFAIHKGYGTADHRQALIERGPCRMHRVSFRGVNTGKAEAKQASSPQQGTLC